MTPEKKMIRMTDGTECPLSEFDYECEARDDAGRHFKGYGECIFDTNDASVVEEDRGYWAAHAWFDGDWGADFDNATDVDRVKKVTKTIEVTVWETE